MTPTVTMAIMIADRALISGLTPRRTAENILIGRATSRNGGNRGDAKTAEIGFPIKIIFGQKDEILKIKLAQERPDTFGPIQFRHMGPDRQAPEPPSMSAFEFL